ncbi:hypothetical protein COL922a_009916 [Colletotrichum nupharicola]|nr:hypothetical protein COL922a_009916 [Colletotrichum nupharicola]
MPVAEISVANQEITRNTAVSAFASQDNFEQPEAVETRNFALNTDLEAPSTSLSKRAMNSKFNIHVVSAAARSITANFNKLTNGTIVATHFEGGANPLAAVQNAVFDFSTSMISGVVDVTLNAAGVATGIASSTGIHLGGTVIAKTLHVFNENNAKIGFINL